MAVRLTGRAQFAFQHVAESSQKKYDDTTAAPKERFEPESRNDLYQIEFQSSKKMLDESWADFAENLTILIDKSYPHLQSAIRQQMALSHYLAQIGNTQITVSVSNVN